MNPQARPSGLWNSNPNASRRFGRYEILAEIASGGMATVFLGRVHGAKGFQRLVAIKRLHPHLESDDQFVAMFLDEARLAARIRHHNVVPTIDIEENDGHYIVMEYVEGDRLLGLLRAASQSGGRMPLQIALTIAGETLAGLHAAHELTDDDGHSLELVHRDVSPQNILIGIDGVTKITDFGIAKAESRLAHTRDGQLKGKISYMAPEQATGANVDRRADLFAMGIILWEMLTGRRLFRGNNDVEVLNALMNVPIPTARSALPELGEELDSVVMTALQRDPSQRFSTAEAFAQALEHAAAGVGGLANTRTVAAYVQSIAGPKLVQERARFRGDNPPLAAPLHDDHPSQPSQPSRVSNSAVRAVEPSITTPRVSPPALRKSHPSANSELPGDPFGSPTHFAGTPSGEEQYTAALARSQSSINPGGAGSSSSLAPGQPSTVSGVAGGAPPAFTGLAQSPGVAGFAPSPGVTGFAPTHGSAAFGTSTTVTDVSPPMFAHDAPLGLLAQPTVATPSTSTPPGRLRWIVMVLVIVAVVGALVGVVLGGRRRVADAPPVPAMSTQTAVPAMMSPPPVMPAAMPVVPAIPSVPTSATVPGMPIAPTMPAVPTTTLTMPVVPTPPPPLATSPPIVAPPIVRTPPPVVAPPIARTPPPVVAPPIARTPPPVVAPPIARTPPPVVAAPIARTPPPVVARPIVRTPPPVTPPIVRTTTAATPPRTTTNSTVPATLPLRLPRTGPVRHGNPVDDPIGVNPYR